jgi:flagellar biosynthetic protein FlhB
MAEDDDEASKTEDPTGKKLGDAREKGNVPQSQEAKTWFALLGGLVVVSGFLPAAVRDLSRALVGYLERAGTTPLDAAKAGGILADSVLKALLTVALPLAVLSFIGISGTLLQTGWLVAWERVKPNIAKLNPLPNLQRMFSAQNAIELGKSLIKFLIVAVIVYIVGRPLIDGIEHYAGLALEQVLRESQDFAVKLYTGVTVVMMIIAGLDFLWQRYSFTKKMRMTKQEVKDEFKQQEGDPVVKGRIKSLRFQKARQRMMANVPKADVVVTNPTHYAIALKYDPASMAAPMMLAKGTDHLAKKIREIAEQHDIPLVSNPPLARALYATVEVDQEIPPEHYKAMAEIISFVFKLKRRTVPN